jgi:hypothetical protein
MRGRLISHSAPPLSRAPGRHARLRRVARREVATGIGPIRLETGAIRAGIDRLGAAPRATRHRSEDQSSRRASRRIRNPADSSAPAATTTRTTSSPVNGSELDVAAWTGAAGGDVEVVVLPGVVVGVGVGVVLGVVVGVVLGLVVATGVGGGAVGLGEVAVLVGDGGTVAVVGGTDPHTCGLYCWHVELCPSALLGIRSAKSSPTSADIRLITPPS